VLAGGEFPGDATRILEQRIEAVMKTFVLTKEAAEKGRKWKVVDAAGVPLGRLASEVASLVRGKYRPDFTPHVDAGDFVVVINADSVRLTGKKLEQKRYYHHSGYIGGIKEVAAGDLLAKNPEKMIREAVKGMLPRGPLGRSLAMKVKVYRNAEHPHQAQQPEIHSIEHVLP
jgi:large subunit ribosomal protein L13